MYLYLQFYKEFTPDLLQDFYGDDKFPGFRLAKQNQEIRVEEGEK